jgi:hypothetical protein
MSPLESNRLSFNNFSCIRNTSIRIIPIDDNKKEEPETAAEALEGAE